MTLNQIGQIALAVSDTDRSEAFYEQTLGLRKLYRYGALAFFDCAGVRLMLSPPENGPHRPNPPPEFCFDSTSAIASRMRWSMASSAPRPIISATSLR